MDGGRPRKRRGGLALAMAVDVVRDARRTRNWAVLFVVLVVASSLLVGATAQFVTPWIVYGGL